MLVRTVPAASFQTQSLLYQVVAAPPTLRGLLLVTWSQMEGPRLKGSTMTDLQGQVEKDPSGSKIGASL